MIVITGLTTMQWHSCDGGGGSMMRLPRAADCKGVVKSIFQNLKKLFYALNKFKLFTQIKGNAINDCDVFKVHNF